MTQAELHQRIADLERELAEARKPLRWTNQAPIMGGWWIWEEDGVLNLDSFTEYALAMIKWNRGTMFYGPIPEPMT